ncbi:MAG: bifunctional (p)ppGpp synthetase/guanosine-3',5'-bis(diphosphate) 3'-pyrophosphohydrolase [Bacteroidetes bacterium]|nr:MAG: bifunctional (p)ppGpp synthetase/guanosine-3',5'-bis(diphosphate) 3'-pyrophosphohydrolase [Bacteroidota bacterium]
MIANNTSNIDGFTDPEKKQILKRYRHLLRRAAPVIKDKQDSRRIREAFNLALTAHGAVRRRSGEPYIYHPLEVARIVVDDMGLGVTSIIAALLHDVVEDTEFQLVDIEKIFGERVARCVDGLTKVKGAFEKGKSEQAENFKKMLLTITEDIRVMFVKIADRLHNMRTLENMPKDKQLKIQSETQYIFAPLAHRLGLYNIKSELEDLCLKYTDPQHFYEIQEKLEQTKDAREKFIKKFVKPIDDKLKEAGFDFEIKHRLKSIHSIWSKIKNQGISFEEIYDIFAVRVILNSPVEQIEQEREDCWRIYAILTHNYKASPERTRDWISFPRANGYESLHTTVMSDMGKWVEVQIRTRRMDDIAEKGLAAHWKYKQKTGGASDADHAIEEWLKKVRETLENKDLSALELLKDFRANLFKNEIYIFTPNGDLKSFPGGSTVLDFAFEIHSQIGSHCMGAKVNGSLVPLNHVLSNGDQVEILKSTKMKVNDGWLKFVTTSKARAKIKEYLKYDQRKVILEGKEILNRKLKQMKLTLSPEIVLQLMGYFDVKSEPDLFFQIGKGIIDHKQIKRFQDNNEEQKNSTKFIADDAKTFKDKMKQQNQSDELIIGKNETQIEYKLAQCCNPVPGDDIFGIATSAKGIKVHRTNCPNAVDIMASFGYRIIKARWASDTSQVFELSFKIIGTDRVGLVNDVTRVISRMKVNMTGINFMSNGGVFEGDISLTVHDKKEADILIETLAHINGVVKVNRVDL